MNFVEPIRDEKRSPKSIAIYHRNRDLILFFVGTEDFSSNFLSLGALTLAMNGVGDLV
jgi:hypothetical protein